MFINLVQSLDCNDQQNELGPSLLLPPSNNKAPVIMKPRFSTEKMIILIKQENSHHRVKVLLTILIPTHSLLTRWEDGNQSFESIPELVFALEYKMNYSF